MGMTWQQLIDKATELRHQLHQKPELSWEETNTAQIIREHLTLAAIPWRECATTGTVATLAPQAKGVHIALRADIDALPILETTNLSWQSQIPGCMHACGHDGHIATLFAAIWWLRQHESDLPGPVSLIFQPAEEGGHGARQMIAEGALEGVDEIYGWHNWPAIPFGQAICPDGPVMAANAVFSITVTGKGGHSSQPDQCRDPVLAAAAITLNLQQIVNRLLAPQQAAVVSLTSIDAKSAATIVPEQVQMAGSVRVADSALIQTVGDYLQSIIHDTAKAYQVRAHIDYTPCYGATINHASEASNFRQALTQELGEQGLSQTVPAPIMASEDFSYYLNEVPGAFALIGSGDDNGHDFSCHSSHYDFNDQLIPVVARLFARLAGAPMP